VEINTETSNFPLSVFAPLANPIIVTPVLCNEIIREFHIDEENDLLNCECNNDPSKSGVPVNNQCANK
jgi:hypothetical protein